MVEGGRTTRLLARSAITFSHLAACGFALMTPPAWGADVDRPADLDQLDVVRSTLFDAEMVLLDVAGHRAFILKPTRPEADGPKPWVWYAPTLLADGEADWKSPGGRHAWMFRRLLEGGLYVVGVDVGESWGSPAGRAVYDKLYDHLVGRFGFARKACLFPISRGGLMAYNWAADHADRVQCIGGIYPVSNFQEFAGREYVRRAYGMNEEQLRAELAKHNPLDRLAPLAAARVPILHVHGDHDTVVPLPSHSAELVRRYRALGGQADLIIIPGKGHEIAPELWQEPRLVEFFTSQSGGKSQ
ncbi:MAG TPA: prolyl oligopeptidase family serine peptidase [Thermoguttaceae bacterium]|nr:prolyl oligopeptidase family serine peptidase [Thermoguttaceae bacterium]